MMVPVVAKLEIALRTILGQPDVVKRLDELDAEVRPGTAAEFSRFWTAEVEKYKMVITKTKLSVS